MTAANEALVRQWWEQNWSKDATEPVVEHMTADYRHQDPTLPDAQTLADYEQMVHGGLHGAFPDVYVEVHDIFGNGDRVVSIWTAHGTSTGAFAGQAPTGRGFSADGISVHRVREGKICEQILTWDALGLARQTGLSLG